MSSARRILLVDDDEDLRESLKDQLALHDEFEIVTAGSASARASRSPRAIISTSSCWTWGCRTWTAAKPAR